MIGNWRNPIRVAVALLWIAAAVAIVWVTVGRDAGPEPVPTAQLGSSPAPPEPGLPVAEATYYRGLVPLVRAAAEEGAALVALGERQERNLLTIRAAQGRMEERLAAVDEFAATQPTPDRFAAALARYREGAVAVRRAIAEASAGFVRLDWDRVARASSLMGRGAAILRQAELMLDEAVGIATPGLSAR
jgi:hypothetical protein